MIRLLADENFRGAIIRGVRLRHPEIDVVTAQECRLSGVDDPSLLEWAAKEGRVLLTHDANTLIGFAYDRVNRSLPMPGVFEIVRKIPIGLAIDDVIILALCSTEGEWEGQVNFLPF